MNRNDVLAVCHSHIEQSFEAVEKLKSQVEVVAELADICVAQLKKGGRVYTFGNGGSACDAMHLAEELVARYLRERPGIRAQHLIDSGTMTCWANDYDFDSIFSRQVETLATADDVVIGFSTSGNSPNVLKGIEAGNKVGAETIAFTGKTGGELKTLAKHMLLIDSMTTSVIQEAHMMVIHMLCDVIEQLMFPDHTSTDKS